MSTKTNITSAKKNSYILLNNDYSPQTLIQIHFLKTFLKEIESSKTVVMSIKHRTTSNNLHIASELNREWPVSCRWVYKWQHAEKPAGQRFMYIVYKYINIELYVLLCVLYIGTGDYNSNQQSLLASYIKGRTALTHHPITNYLSWYMISL